MFALLALAGDAGCMLGPSAVGAIADAFGGNIRAGIAFGMAVPVAMLVVLAALCLKKRSADAFPHTMEEIKKN